VARIAELLERETLTWEPGEHGRLEIVHDDERLAWIDGSTVVLEERRLELRDVRGQTTLYDVGRAARVATLRLVGQGTGRVGAVTLPRHRIRVSKVAVNPFRWEVTDGLGGPQLLEALKVFGRMRIRKGAGFDPAMDVGLAAVALVLTAMPEVGAAPAAA
jgi:hypothetical protein